MNLVAVYKRLHSHVLKREILFFILCMRLALYKYRNLSIYNVVLPNIRMGRIF